MAVDPKELARCPLFGTLPAGDLAHIAAAARVVRSPAGPPCTPSGNFRARLITARPASWMRRNGRRGELSVLEMRGGLTGVKVGRSPVHL